jgi:hypothetical protein
MNSEVLAQDLESLVELGLQPSQPPPKEGSANIMNIILNLCQ